jgi:DNA-binding MarR family transcriptional regulator
MDYLVQYLIHSLKEEEIYKSNQIWHKESYILRLITLGFLTNKILRVSDLLSNQDLGSNPTIQSYINKLVLKDFVVRNTSEQDKRVQFLIPTQKAMNLFEELSKALYDAKISSSLKS